MWKKQVQMIPFWNFILKERREMGSRSLDLGKGLTEAEITACLNVDGDPVEREILMM